MARDHPSQWRRRPVPLTGLLQASAGLISLAPLVREFLVIGGLVDLLGQVGVTIASAGAVVLFAWFRDFFVYRLALAWRWVYTVVSSKRYVLVWIDDEASHSRKLIRKLREVEAEHVAYRALRRPRALLFYPLSPRRVKAVVLLDTDVSKLADEPNLARRIEERLRRYVDAGGGVIGSHDLIYRRVRSEGLQEVFGCKITNFEGYRSRPVPYRINPAEKHHPLRQDLPDAFQLDDCEICWGQWAPDAMVVYSTDDENERPLVVAREYSEGRVVWINSGDKGEWLCGSIAKPEESLVLLLRNGLNWVGQPS